MTDPKPTDPTQGPQPAFDTAGVTSELPTHDTIIEAEPSSRARPPARPSTDASALLGVTLGPCKILSLIGEGGLGRVYRARHVRLETDVAVKVIAGSLAKAELLARFKREATIAARLDHPHVARVLDTNEQDGVHYIIQELVAGTTLEGLVRQGGPLPIEKATEVGIGLASGLQAIHQADVVHRDVKPANVMITPEGRPKLLDFGIAKDLGGADLTEERAMLGTPTFLAPEQVDGQHKVGPPADAYALGGTLFFALTGFPPIPQLEDDTLLRFLSRRLKQAAPDVRTRRPEVPAPLASLLAKLLEIDPAARPSVRDALDALKALSPGGQASRSTQAFARQSGIQGSLESMPLVELLQGIEFNAKTGSLEIEAEKVSGVIEFKGGTPWSARTADGSQDEEAIRRLLALGSGSFALRPEPPREGSRRVKVSFTRLLLDQSRIEDEAGQPAVEEPPPPPPPPAVEKAYDDSSVEAPALTHTTAEVEQALRALEAATLPDPVGDPFLGCKLGRFEAERLVGVVQGERRYLAIEPATEARYLLRVFPLFGLHAGQFRLLAGRAEAALRVEEAHLERCVGAGRTGDAFFAAFEPPVGKTVAALLETEKKPCPPEGVLNVIDHVAHALRALHRANLVHAAISPETIRLEASGVAILLDAGLARPHPVFAFLGATTPLGAPGYAAPEALDQGTVSAQADIYALGRVAHALLTGEAPVIGDSPLALLERAQAPLAPVTLPSGAALPPAFAALLANMTAVDPRERYASVNDLLVDVRAVRQGEAVRPLPRAPKLTRRQRGLLSRASPLVTGLLTALALVLAAAAVGTFAWAQTTPLEDPLDGYVFKLPG